MNLSERLTRQQEAASAPSTNAAAPAESKLVRALPDTGARQPARDAAAELKARVHGAVVSRLGAEIIYGSEGGDDLAERVRRAVREELSLDRTPLSRDERRLIEHEIADDVLGLRATRAASSATTPSPRSWSTAPDQIYDRAPGQDRRRPTSRFLDDEHLLRIIDRIVSRVGRRIDEASPMVDARLPDGSRVNAIIPPLALRRPVAHDPQVLARSVHGRGPHRLRHAHRRRRRSSSPRASAASSTS